MEKLYIVIPAYNEEETIESVCREWHEVVQAVGNGSRLIVLDDGSKDSTYEKLVTLQQELHYLEPITKTNSGHGATVLYGYNYALSKLDDKDYVFQTDSDGQTRPEEFWDFWSKRHDKEVIIGYRKNRQDGLSRIFVTKTLRLVLLCCFGHWIIDANTPFRLMKASVLKRFMGMVPKDFNLSNVMLTVLFTHYKVSMEYLPITFRPRQGGVNSINFRKITKIGQKAVQDFLTIRKSLTKPLEEDVEALKTLETV